MRTTECSCRLWPMPGIYAVTSSPLVRRTRATFRSAEFGFLGVIVLTCVQTPRRWGLPATSNERSGRSGWPGFGPVWTTRKAGVFTFFCCFSRPLRTNWLIVGTFVPLTHTKMAAPSVGRNPRIIARPTFRVNANAFDGVPFRPKYATGAKLRQQVLRNGTFGPQFFRYVRVTTSHELDVIIIHR